MLTEVTINLFFYYLDTQSEFTNESGDSSHKHQSCLKFGQSLNKKQNTNTISYSI